MRVNKCFLLLNKFLLAFAILFLSTNSFKLSSIIKYLTVGDFIADLREEKFNWENYVSFLKNLPFDKPSEKSIDYVRNFTSPIFELLDRNMDLITQEYMRVVELKHGDLDVKRNLRINLKVAVLLRISELGVRVDSLMPNDNVDSLAFIGGGVINKLPNSLLFPTYGIDQEYYVDYSQFSVVKESDIIQINEKELFILQKGENLAKYANNVPKLDQSCGSCLAFSSAAVLTHFYFRYYLSQSKIDTSNLQNKTDIFIEPYQLLTCVNNQIKVDELFSVNYSKTFPRSNGYYLGHACFGGMSPEMLFWAKYNPEKLGSIDINKSILNKRKDLENEISNNSIKLGKYCNDVSMSVKKLDLPFPKFELKHVPRTILKPKNAREIAETIMRIINKYGFIFASLYYDPTKGRLFNCNISINKRETTQTYHYVAIAGVEYLAKSSINDTEQFNILIHNSWGHTWYDKISIMDHYIDCNVANALFVLDS